MLGFVTYVKNRRIGSAYPSINAKPSTKALKTEKKIRVYLLSKLVKCVNALPMLRYRDPIIMGDTIELSGTCICRVGVWHVRARAPYTYINSFLIENRSRVATVIGFSTLFQSAPE